MFPIGDLMRRYAEEMHRQRLAELEEQGHVFLRMGYAPGELVVVQHPDGTQEVTPKSALKEDGDG